jgi:hypothetical protein
LAVAVSLLFARSGLSAAPPEKMSPTAAEHRWAVLISASAYESLSPFPSRNQNMTLLKECLLQAGFRPERVLLMSDAVEDPLLRPTKANLENQLQWLRGQSSEHLPAIQSANLTAADEVVVAIALYGVRDGDARYLCPVDCKLPDPNEPDLLRESALPVQAVRDAMSDCPAGRKLLLLNVFNDDPRPRARSAGDKSELQQFNVNDLRPPQGYGELVGYDERHIEAKDVGAFLNIVVSGLQGQADFFGGNRDRWVSLLELADHVQKQPGVLFKAVFAGNDYPLGPVQSEPPPALTARYDVLMRLSAVLLQFQMNDPAVDSSSRAIRNAPNTEAAVKGYVQRSGAYLGKADFDAALADCSRAEKPLTAVCDGRYPIRSGTTTVGWVQPGQTILITKVQGDWVGVVAGQGAGAVRGWLQKDTCRLRPASARQADSPNQPSR